LSAKQADSAEIGEKSTGKLLPTTEGQKRTKKHFIMEYAKNRPASALEIANKAQTTTNYVYKVLSQIKKPSKIIRGRNGRIFAHGKAYFGFAVMPDTALMLDAPVVNHKTGMKQIGFKKINPCSCQIHSNGKIVIWAHSIGWKEWLVNEFMHYGWSANVARFVVEQAIIHYSTLEAGVKPLDSSFLPAELCIEAEWGLAIVRDNTPEKGVLEIKLDIPKMQHFLGLPEIQKRLAVIEQGSVMLNQAYKSVVALLLTLDSRWETIYKSLYGVKEDDTQC
jgi:hypothetical protein